LLINWCQFLPEALFAIKGVQPLLDAVVDYLPSPLDVGQTIGVNPKTGAEEKRTPDASAPLAGLSFKIQIDPHVWKINLLPGLFGDNRGRFIYPQ